MQRIDFDDVIRRLVVNDPRYQAPAYYFLREALEHARKPEPETRKTLRRHLTGREVLEGVRRLALEQYGPMARTVLAEWGIHRCEDIGELVFNMVDGNLLSKTDEDSRDDFKGVYDFHEAFTRPFLPPSKLVSGETEAAATLSKPADGASP